MKTRISIVAIVVIVLAGATAWADLPAVNVSLKPTTGTVVGVGETFDLQLWLESTTPDVVMHTVELILGWDPAYVSFAGSASTADGDYLWSTVLAGPPSFPMYPSGIGDGNADIMLYAGNCGFPWVTVPYPQTDQHALTLTFTALAETNSTTSITIAPDLPTGIKAEWFSHVYTDPVSGVETDIYYVSECSGTMEGAEITIIPAPGAILLGAIGLGMVGWVKRRFDNRSET